ncbi:hypothetical protein PJL18_03151 [Paenarthrobacter nicotinovorans]|nr:hypothetical protein [Paenarthrobacter nicotinovorans]
MGNYAHAGCVLCRSDEVGGRCRELFLAEAVEFLLRGLELVQRARDAIGKLAGRDLQKLGQFSHQCALRGKVTERVQAYEGLDAPVSRTYGLLAQQRKAADEGGVGYVGATAQLT